jgi:hypothetical protein
MSSLSAENKARVQTDEKKKHETEYKDDLDYFSVLDLWSQGIPCLSGLGRSRLEEGPAGVGGARGGVGWWRTSSIGSEKLKQIRK